MKNRRVESLVLILILIFSAFLYFYKINVIPNGVYSDEATVGYNAYSILLTGRDEFGKFFPFAFRFFGAYTPPLYVYLIVPFIKLFGLTPFAIRALSGIATIFGVYLVYIFIKSLKLTTSPKVPLISAFLFTICPWVVFNARLGYEVTLGYILFSFGAYLLWKGIAGKYVSISGLLILSLSTYIAHTERYLVPIFILAVVILYSHRLKTFINKKLIFHLGLLLLVTQIPNLFLVTTKSFWVKNSVYSGVGLSQILSDFTSQLLTYFSPSDLFGQVRDINLQHSVPLIPLFYSWLIVPFFIGLYQLYLKKSTPAGQYLWLMFILSPIPGSLSGHFNSTQRVLTMIVPIIFIISLGIDFISVKLKRFVAVPAFIVLSLFSLLLLWRSYFIFLPQERAIWWSFGFEQFTDITQENLNTNYVLDNTRQPATYMSILYHLRYSPVAFQSQFSHEFLREYYSNPPYNPNYKIANIDVRPIIWGKDIFIEQVLVGDRLSISPEQAKEHFLEKEFEIKDPLGDLVLVGYRTNPKMKTESNRIKTLNRRVQ